MQDKGFIDQVEGKAKEVAGKVTGDAGMEAEGFVNQAVGKAKEIASDVKDVAEEIGEKIEDALTEGK